MKRIVRFTSLLLITVLILMNNGIMRVFADEIPEDQAGIVDDTVVEDDEDSEPSGDTDLIVDDSIYTDSEAHNHIVDFVIRLYSYVLDREYDRYGLDCWTSDLEDQIKTGSEVGYGFVFSDEYRSKCVKPEDYVEMLYNVFLGRPSDPEGKAGWVCLMYEGYSYEYIFEGFVNSREYSDICQDYGITRGEYHADRIQDTNLGVTGFVMRLYDTILGRWYDSDGLNSWCELLLTKKMSFEEVAAEFVNSEEFLNLDLDDTEYVKTLYTAFLDRECDDYGVRYWTEQLSNGMTRDEILQGFAESDEFKDLIGSYTNELNGVKMPLPHSSYITWAEVMADTRKLELDVEELRSDLVDLADKWTEIGASYRFGGKVIQSGSIDCSGYVTYLYRVVLGTMSDIPESYGSSLYGNYFNVRQDTTYRGMWNDYASVNYPMIEGRYNIRSAPSVQFFVDKYGLGSPNLMDTREWVYYLNTVGVTSTTVSIEQLRQMPYWHFDEDRPQSFSWDWIDEYKAGDIIIWFENDGTSVHIGMYDGHGGVYHSSSYDYQAITENNLGIQHSDLRAIGCVTPRTSLSYFIIYHMT